MTANHVEHGIATFPGPSHIRCFSLSPQALSANGISRCATGEEASERIAEHRPRIEPFDTRAAIKVVGRLVCNWLARESQRNSQDEKRLTDIPDFGGQLVLNRTYLHCDIAACVTISDLIPHRGVTVRLQVEPTV